MRSVSPVEHSRWMCLHQMVQACLQRQLWGVFWVRLPPWGAAHCAPLGGRVRSTCYSAGAGRQAPVWCELWATVLPLEARRVWHLLHMKRPLPSGMWAGLQV